MYLYRIVKNASRATDLSGTGAFRVSGRWHSKGTYMLYTSENSSLAYLESLVHFDKALMPPNLFIIQLSIPETASVYSLPDKDYPAEWLQLGLIENQQLGDRWMLEKKYLAIKVKSAINVLEYNFLLNPHFPNYHNLVKISSVIEIDVNNRLVK